VLRTIYGGQREEVAERQRKLHNQELRNLYSSPDIVRMTKSRGIVGQGLYSARERRPPSSFLPL
jgi:hypothetical protein